MLPFPHIDPVIVAIGPLKIHWYAVSYVLGILFAVYYGKYLLKKYPAPLSPSVYEYYLFGPAILGGILGGRLGHVIFYESTYYLEHPLEILMTWKGGMSFHGAVLGVIMAALYTGRKHKIHPLFILDILAVFAPVGLGLGRLANFINGELYGRITDVRWGIIFPEAGPYPRHPTQIYEAVFEGLILFEILRILFMQEKIRHRRGFLGGAFLFFYGIFRFGIEFFKDPVAQGGMTVDMLSFALTQGHILCVPMILFGGYFMIYSKQIEKS